MKQFFLVFLMVGLLSGCTVLASDGRKEVPASTEEEQVNPLGPEKLIMQRGYDIYTFSDPSPEMGILVNAKDMYFLAYRRLGKDLGVKNERELPFLRESQEEGSSTNDYTYLRMVQAPYYPEEGENARPRKDIILYLDQANPNDILVGAQDPTERDSWHIYQVEDYGKWLIKEIDLYIALYKGL